MSDTDRQLLIRGGDVVDSAGRRRADVLVSGANVIAVGESLDAAAGVYELDATGCVVGAGLVDLFADFGGPGNEELETTETAARAAALGGYTTVLVATSPSSPIDSLAALAEREAVETDICSVRYSAAITMGHRGERLAPMGELARAGVCVFSDGGRGVVDTDLLRHAFEYGSAYEAVFSVHPEDPTFGRHGVMHEGSWSSRLGLPGRTATAELVGVQRLLALCELTGARLHVHRPTTAPVAALLAGAADIGLPVTTSVAPHHLVFTDADCGTYDTNRRFDPPLRPEIDVEGLRGAVESCAIDAVVSDHTPRTSQSKELPFDQAPTGSVGLETTLAVLLSRVGLSVETVFEVLSRRPAEIAGLSDYGAIEPGSIADLCVVDPTAEWTVRSCDLASRSTNTAFEGQELAGRVRHTVHSGNAVVIDGKGQW